jgi:hypothetical protein
MDESRKKSDKTKLWKARLIEAAAYPGSAVGYCKAKGISRATFHYWKKRLSKKDNEVVTSPFARIQVEEPQVRDLSAGLPDPRWVAEVLLYLQRGAR